MRCGGKDALVLFVSAAFLSLAAVTIRADFITPTSQTRAIDVASETTSAETTDFDSASDAAPDFSLFDRTAACLANVEGSASTVSAGGTARQRSEILGDRLTATGGLDLFAQGDALVHSGAAGSSLFSVTFQVATTIGYTLNGAIGTALNGPEEVFAGITLTGPDGDIISRLITGNDADSVSMAGLLMPGEYTLEAFASGQLSANAMNPESSLSGTYEVDLVFVPEPTTAFFGVTMLGLLLVRNRRR